MAAEDLGNGQELIDALLQFGLELNLADTYTTTEWRPRARFAAQRAVNEFWRAGDWEARFVNEAPLVLTSTGIVTAPADLLRVGPNGGVFAGPQRQKVSYKNPEAFLRYRRQNSTGRGSYPDIYTLRGVTAAGLPTLLFYRPPSSGNVDIVIDYERKPPTILDSAVAGNGLDLIPLEYRHDIIYVGALDWLQSGVGDARSVAETSPRFRMALDQAVSERNHQLDGLQQIADEGIAEEEMW